MSNIHFGQTDQAQFQELGITEVQVRDQLEMFSKPPYSVELERSCTLGDGIIKIQPEEAEDYIIAQQREARQGRFIKFVPASGAATRMFKFLLQVQQEYETVSWEEVNQGAKKGNETLVRFKRFMNEMPRFAFYDELREVMSNEGLDLAQLIRDGQFDAVLRYLLTERGLNYGAMAKGLLKFHRYSWGSRTAFEEHLVEAAQYAKDADGSCRLHFTILPEHETHFRSLLEGVRAEYERQYGARFEVGFSFQNRSSDTIAVDLHNVPFRDRSGRLVFRPGGHGALLENLSKLRDRLVYIKNIDNVVPDCLKAATYFWKLVLGGLLVKLEARIHSLARRLKTEATDAVQKEAEEFVRDELWIDFPGDYEDWPPSKQHHFLLTKLNRPIRVCGVVENAGEPGGAPFWVKDQDGTRSMQIVEKAQVDFDSEGQKSIWNSSTHFNPVDLVCSMRDFEGKPFDLNRHVNREAVFISKKSMGGRDLKALELPGLWNGGMADWITLCVEVPIITFNPVKSVDDLLRAEHQQGGKS